MSWHPTSDRIFDLLPGRWHLDRTVPGHATMHGIAIFTPDLLRQSSSRPQPASPPHQIGLRSPGTGPTLLYTEQVRMQTAAGASLTGSAQYLFAARPDGALDVYLRRTGALFHTLHFARSTLGHLEARAIHPCAADTYTSTYRLFSPDQLTIEHIVTGPRKHYTALTTLTRPS